MKILTFVVSCQLRNDHFGIQSCLRHHSLQCVTEMLESRCKRLLSVLPVRLQRAFGIPGPPRARSDRVSHFRKVAHLVFRFSSMARRKSLLLQFRPFWIDAGPCSGSKRSVNSLSQKNQASIRMYQIRSMRQQLDEFWLSVASTAWWDHWLLESKSTAMLRAPLQ